MIKPFFSNKGTGSASDIQLLESGKMMSEPESIANTFNTFYTTIANTIGEIPSQHSLSLSSEEFVDFSVDKY